MAYIRIGEDESTLGFFGCGPGCSCAGCRQTADSVNGLGERYVPEEAETTPPPAPRPVPAAPPVSNLSHWDWNLGQPAPAGPVFRFDCSIGCAPLPPFVCHGVLRQGILDGCRLAFDAARKLEANPRHRITVQDFRDFFTDEPSRHVPSVGNQQAAAIVARRFRQVEEALRRRGTLYRCGRCDAASCSEARAMGGILDAHAIAFPSKNEVWLCPSFWRLTKFLRAGVLLHEMFHLHFGRLFDHAPTERRGTSAYCYEGFALRVARHAPELLVIQKCQATPT
jgi:hypothetical protein